IGLRSDSPINDEIRDKVALFCDVNKNAVIPLMTAESIYEVPLMLYKSHVVDLVIKKLKLSADVTAPDLEEWRVVVNKLKYKHPKIRIALVGKYVELHDAYMSVREALIHAGLAYDYEVKIKWIHSESLEHSNDVDKLLKMDGIVVPGGFGYRGIEGKILAAGTARRNKIPYLGLCLGMQVMCIEFARSIYQCQDPNSTEFDPKTEYPIISLMPDQHSIIDMGGTMRLGGYPCVLKAGTRAQTAYGEKVITERHRHRFEFNNAYRAVLYKAGMEFSGMSPNGRLVEIAEIKEHPWMVGTQFHPEFKSRIHRPHPLFKGFVYAAIQRKKTRKED
ncbi:MAG: CTP synthase, partial [Anaerolineales bacterium]